MTSDLHIYTHFFKLNSFITAWNNSLNLSNQTQLFKYFPKLPIIAFIDVFKKLLGELAKALAHKFPSIFLIFNLVNPSKVKCP